MIATVILALQVVFTPPPEALASQFYRALWSDLELNAWIGNGNWPASLWYQGDPEQSSALHIENLRCQTSGQDHRCAFDLFREGGPVMTIYNQIAPDRLTCTATIVATTEEGEAPWSVLHYPPAGYGHSLTSLECKMP